MSDYPRVHMLSDSTCEVLGGHEPVRATNGALHLRRMFTSEKRNLLIMHILTPAERSALAAHYAANKDLSFAFYWPTDNATYTVVYAAAPRYSRAGTRFSQANVSLMEV